MSMSSFSPLLAFEDVTVVYSGRQVGERTALSRLSLRVGRGEWVAVMGANGSGKSTLARVAVGLLAPTAGRLQTNTEGPLRIGYLSQQPEHHIVGLTVADDLRLALEPLGLSEGEVLRRSHKWLEAVGMVWALGVRTNALSGGELQRVALAGALAREPDLLVLDEPNAFADPRSARLVAHVVGKYLRASGAACLWITHAPEEAALADRVVVLNGGKVAFDGPPENLWRLGTELNAWGIGRPMEQTPGMPPSRPAQRRATGAPLLQMADLKYSYADRKSSVLSGVDLQLQAGEAVAVVGRSGAGKSTLLQVAAGLEAAHGGELVVLGTPIPARRRGWRAQKERARALRAVLPDIGYAMQQPEAQLFASTVRDELTFGLRNLGVPEPEWTERIEKALAAVGLDSSFLDRSPFNLSGGERRKVALAVCLAQQPRIYLFDEPTAGLDRPSAERIAEALRDVVRSGEAAVLFATHDAYLLETAASRVIALEGGQIKTEGAYQLFAAEDDLEGSERPVVEEKPAEMHTATGGGGVDARVVLLGASLIALSIVSVRHWSGLIAAAAVVTGLLAVMKAPWSMVRSTFLGLLPFMVIATLLGSGGPAVSSGGLRGQWSGGLFIALRMFLTVVSLLWVGRVLPLSELMNAFASLLRPLVRFGLPLDTLLAATLVAMAMLPRLAEEAGRIVRAQAMRGVQHLRGLRGIWTRVATLAIPLSAASMRRAERMGDALVLRGYLDGDGWRPKVRRLQRRDGLAFAALASLAALVLLANIWGG